MKLTPKYPVTTPITRSPSYRQGIAWIGLNDEPSDMDTATVSSLISVLLLADLFGKHAEEVATDVVRYREQQAALDEAEA